MHKQKISRYDLVILLRANAFGGSERHTLDMIRLLISAGRRVAFVHSGPGLGQHGLEKCSNLLVFHVDTAIQNLNRQAKSEWLSVFRELRADRVLFVKPSYYAAHLSFLKLVRSSYSIVYNLEHSVPPPRGRPTHRIHFGILPGIGLWWYRDAWYRWRSSKLVDRVITVSDASRRELLSQTFLRPHQVQVCRNAVDLTYWNFNESAGEHFRQKLGIPSKWYLFGCIGHLFPVKAFDIAIEALAILFAQEYKNIALCLVGDGDQLIRLQQLSVRLGVSDRIFFVGKMCDVRPAYSAIQTLLVPSKIEAFGLVVLEALACGCRVVAADVGGIPEVITDPVFGELIQSRNPEEWAHVMKRHVADKLNSERDRFTQDSRASLEKAHNQHKQLQRLESLLFGEWASESYANYGLSRNKEFEQHLKNREYPVNRNRRSY